jgi:hypothetical protein
LVPAPILRGMTGNRVGFRVLGRDDRLRQSASWNTTVHKGEGVGVHLSVTVFAYHV